MAGDLLTRTTQSEPDRRIDAPAHGSPGATFSCNAFDARAFRHALGQFATGVAIVTADCADGQPIGMTISSLNSVSLDPPLMLFSIARNAQSLPGLCAAEAIGINILRDAQRDLSDRFSRARADKWQGTAPMAGESGAPLLPDALAHFECRPHARYDGGDHVIFVVRVVGFSASAVSEPLIFYRGRYHSLPAADAPLRENA